MRRTILAVILAALMVPVSLAGGPQKKTDRDARMQEVYQLAQMRAWLVDEFGEQDGWIIFTILTTNNYRYNSWMQGMHNAAMGGMSN